MANRRAHLRDLTCQIRRYLARQKKSGVDAYVPASDEDRAEFEARKKALEERQIEQLRSGGDEDTSDDEPRFERPAPKPTEPAPPATEDAEEQNQSAGGGRVTADTPLWKKHDPIHEMTGRADDGAEQMEEETDSAQSSAEEKPASNKDGDAPKTPEEKMDFLRDYLGDCKRCPLSENRTNVVFGDGDPNAQLMFVGEGPGREEDRQGLPFVGPSGQLLTKMIEGMGLERSDVYITNVVKCRPPKNRNPAPLEIKECSPFLRKQIEVVEPDVIVTVGKFASNTLLEKDEALKRLRGRWHEHLGVPVMPTYHPAYLLRNEGDRELKKRTWNDLKMVMERLGLEQP